MMVVPVATLHVDVLSRLIEAEWRIYAPVTWPSLVDNGLAPGRRQAII